VERYECRDVDELRQRHHENSFRIHFIDVRPEHRPHRRHDCESKERARNDERNSSLANEVAELPVGVTREIRRHQFCSPTASRNCCSSTDREGTTPATSTPPPISRARAPFSSTILEKVSSNSPSPESTACGNIALR